MIKLIKHNCEGMALIESLLRANQNMYIVGRGDNVRLWKVQKEFEPVVAIREYELLMHGDLLPVKLRFEYNDIAKEAFLKTNEKGIKVLKQCMPDVFEHITESGEEQTFELPKKYVPKANPKAKGDSD